MSSETSTNTSSRLSQFGLYKTIDERTEEFLKLSKRRQVKQGCICAAISTAVTVAVVIVILLIYEYTITVESNLVQRRRKFRRNDTNIINDTPVADRLDRSYLGFDQDYFEQMPLLVNAMQENSYIDSSHETSYASRKRAKYLESSASSLSPVKHRLHIPDNGYLTIRRTSPRPFIFEYRSPTPVPFHKKINSRSWVESYRNAQRLKNLEQVIHYLEKTINAKFGDLYGLPPTTHIAFSGVYVEPSSQKQSIPTTTPSDLMTQESNVQVIKKGNKEDPYFSFKPENPGDVNLLADVPLKFAPIPTLITARPTSNLPMFRPLPHLKGCIGIRCNIQNNVHNKILNILQGSAEIESSETAKIFEKPKSFSVMLNLFPVGSTTTGYYKRKDIMTTPMPLNKIYITSAEPPFLFRRKSVDFPGRKRSFVIRRKRPRMKTERKEDMKRIDLQSSERFNKVGPKVILHVNVFPEKEVNTTTTTTTEPTSTTTIVTSTVPQVNVEDYHVGSSGIIPIEERIPSTTPLPKVTTLYPFLENNRQTAEDISRWSTKPPEILKFSEEDAKIPDAYQKFRGNQEYNLQTPTESIRRTSSLGPTDEKEESERKTLIVKLKNYLDIPPSSTEVVTENTSESAATEAHIKETTAINTYVPQMNGHYRNVIQKLRNSSLIGDRKSRLEITVTGHKKPLPRYVEINRNRKTDDSDE